MAGDGNTPRLVALGRLSAELLVIVVGVLIALGVDTWWAGVQDRQLESAALESLSSELGVAEDQLQDYVGRDSLIMRRADALLARSSLPADTLADLVSGIFNTIPDEVRLRSYDELLSTGRLQLLRDREVRLALLEFDAAARTLAGYSDQMEIQWNETARPVLYRTVNWDHIASQLAWAFGTPGVDSGQPQSSLSVQLDPELRAVIRDRRAFAAVHVRRVTNTLDVLERLREIVDD